jgi:pimeloyl-ACP methyl ester carboxylesterase
MGIRGGAAAVGREVVIAPKRRRFTTSADGSIEVAALDWGGDGPIALLHHANGLCAATWTLVAEALARHYRVVAIDARGHGDSSVPPAPQGYPMHAFVDDLVAVVRALRAETGHARIAYGIGSSFGGIVTAAAEAKSPGSFECIAMLDPPIHPDDELRARLDPNGGIVDPRPQIAAQARRRTAVWPSRETARQAWSGRPMFARWQPRAFDTYLAEGFRDRSDGQVELKCAPDVEATIFASSGDLDIYALAPAVRVPVLLVRAARGNLPSQAFAHLAELLPDCTSIAPDLGHLMPLEDPEPTVALLLDFADATSRRRDR